MRAKRQSSRNHGLRGSGKHCGPWIQVDKEQFERVLRYIDLGKSEGATLLTGGKPAADKGYYIEPTIFADVKVTSTGYYVQYNRELCQIICTRSPAFGQPK